MLYGIEGAVYIIPATFLVAMATEVPPLAPFAPYAWVAVGLITAPSIALWSALASRLGAEAALVCAAAAQGITLVTPAVAGGATGVLLPALGLGVTAMGITALGTSLGHAYWPARRNTAVGALTVLYGVGQIVGPLVATHIELATGSYRASLPLAGVALLVPTVVFALGLRRRRSQREPEIPSPA